MISNARRKKCAGVLTVCAMALLVLSGCGGRSLALEKELVKTCQDYTELFAAKRYNDCKQFLTGQALSELELSQPLLQAMSAVDTKLSGFKGSVDFMNDSKDRASVRCGWTQEQSVPGSQTVISRLDVVYDMVLLKGKWLISEIKLLSQTEEGKSAEGGK